MAVNEESAIIDALLWLLQGIGLWLLQDIGIWKYLGQ